MCPASVAAISVALLRSGLLGGMAGSVPLAVSRVLADAGSSIVTANFGTILASVTAVIVAGINLRANRVRRQARDTREIQALRDDLARTQRRLQVVEDRRVQQRPTPHKRRETDQHET